MRLRRHFHLFPPRHRTPEPSTHEEPGSGAHQLWYHSRHRKVGPGTTTLRYKEHMDALCLGHALWHPSPYIDQFRISVGDVGFICQGAFYPLFSACFTPEERKWKDRVLPEDFERLDVGTLKTVRNDPSCFHSNAIPPKTGADAVGPRADSQPSITDGPSHGEKCHKNSSAGSHIRTGFTLRPTESQGPCFQIEFPAHKPGGVDGGAAVATLTSYSVDATNELALEEYIKRYYNSWVRLVKGGEGDAELILVSGFHVANGHDAIVYDEKNKICTNVGKDSGYPPPVISPSQLEGVGNIPSEYDEYIFLRYYTMRMRPQLPAEAHDTLDSWGVVADYVFKHCSDAKAVLMHTSDLDPIYKMGSIQSLTERLKEYAPNIEVDKDGVARIRPHAHDSDISTQFRAPLAYQSPNLSN